MLQKNKKIKIKYIYIYVCVYMCVFFCVYRKKYLCFNFIFLKVLKKVFINSGYCIYTPYN